MSESEDTESRLVNRGRRYYRCTNCGAKMPPQYSVYPDESPDTALCPYCESTSLILVEEMQP